MIEKIAGKLTAYLSKCGAIDEARADVYMYGLDILISTLWNAALIVATALAFGRPLDALLYVACSFPLRRYGGGWHASTHARCAAMSTLTFAAVSCGGYLLCSYINYVMLFLLGGVSVGIAVWQAPSQHPDNPVDEDARPRLRRMCIAWSISAMLVSLVCYWLGRQDFAATIALSSLSATATFLVKNRVSD